MTMQTLIDGRLVPSDSEDWRLECEARYVCAMPGIDARRLYMAGINKQRGEASYLLLADKVRQVWAKHGRRND